MTYVPPAKIIRARALRKTETSAENKLWNALRNRQLMGLKFVRQMPIGKYFVDFACRERRLIIEVDGATHGETQEKAYDQVRSEFLARQGWLVCRVQNQDVYENLSGVCDEILIRLNLWKETSP